MLEISKYSFDETLRGGLQIEIRALRPGDGDKFMSAVSRLGDQSLYRRFFAFRRNFSERERSYFVNVDFCHQVALIAVVKKSGQPEIAGGARYITENPGRAEVALTVVDNYQGKGIGSALMRHLIRIAHLAGLRELTAQVLPENLAMLKVFEKCGLKLSTKHDLGAVLVSLQLEAPKGANDLPR
jgi:RimJ/RimL family protein N-acetyltransferase